MEKRPSAITLQLLKTAAEAGVLTFGELIEPGEMQQRVTPGAFAKQHLCGWFLTGEMSQFFYQALKRGERPHVVAVARKASTGLVHFVAQLRVKHAAHRFVLPCTGEFAGRFLEDLRLQGFGIGLWVGRGSDIHISLTEASAGEAIPVSQKPESRQDKEHMAWALLNAGSQLLLPLPLMLHESAPPQVNVTIVVPGDLVDDFDQVLASSIEEATA